LREKTFANFTVLWQFAKVFSTKFGGMAFIGTAKGSNPQKFSPRKSIHECFLCRKFPLYVTSPSGEPFASFPDTGNKAS